MEAATRQLTWPVPDAKVENSTVPDQPNRRLFIATYEPAKFIVFNNRHRKVVTTLPCSRFHAHAVDQPRKLIYATASEPATVIGQAYADLTNTLRRCRGGEEFAFRAGIKAALRRDFGEIQAGREYLG